MLTAAAWIVLGVALLTGPPARLARRETAPVASGFPGQPRHPGARPFRFLVWAVAAAVAVAATAALTLWGGSPTATLVVAASGAVVLAALAWRLLAYGRACRGIRRAIDAHAPRVAVPYAGRAGAHVAMWSPWIEQAGVPWCIVSRDPEIHAELAARHAEPVILREVPSSVRAALYPHGSQRNALWLEREDLTHVFLGHGDSDKPLSASDRVLAYDVVTVAGQAAIDRFAAAGIEVPPHRLRVIGRPQTEGIERGRSPVPSPATVLYAPTWRHADDALDISSLAVADRVVAALLGRGCTVVFRRHFAGRNHLEAEAMIERVVELLAADADRTGRPHWWGEEAMTMPLVEAFNRCDAMVSDVSGIVVDFMASEKPFAMYARQHRGPTAEEDFRSAHPTARSAYVVDRDLQQLGTALDAMLGADPLASVRPERADHYLGGPQRIDPTGRFVALVRELAGPDPHSA